MSQPFDDLYSQVQDLQNTSDNNQPTVDALTNILQPDGTIRAQLDYPLDTQSVQEIQELIPTANIQGGNVVSNAAGPLFPTGWIVAHTATGRYTITHTLGTTTFAVSATVISATCIIYTYTKTSTSFDIGINTYSGSAIDSDFDFLVTY